MPPKPKFTREQVIFKAFEIVRKQGFAALTARSLGAALGSSSRPIFTLFESMDEVVDCVYGEARALYAGYVEKGLSESLSFRGVGMQYIKFALEEPMLFRLLFMGDTKDTGGGIAGVLPSIEEHYDAIVSSVKEQYGLDEKRAIELYRHLWIYTHGIATLCATDTCRFTAEEIAQRLRTVLLGVLAELKSGDDL